MLLKETLIVPARDLDWLLSFLTRKLLGSLDFARKSVLSRLANVLQAYPASPQGIDGRLSPVVDR
jgi:hypothetical protein